MSLSKASTRIGLFALLLSVIVLSLFGSLLAADRALTRAAESTVLLDANGAALVAERELRLRGEALNQLFGPLLSRSSSTPDSSVVPAAMDAAWVLDRSGRVAWRGTRAGALWVDSATLAAAAHDSSATEWPRIRALRAPTDSNRGAIVLLARLSHRGQHLGTAVGVVGGQDLLGRLQSGASQRARLAIRASDRTIAALDAGSTGPSVVRARSRIQMPGESLWIEIAHSQSGRELRTALWILGVIGLAALVVALARERRQALYLADRTTELERLYQEVARSNRMKSEFLANVSHELRTPLNAVVGFVEMLREGVYGELSPRQALPVDRIAASATHLRHLVDRLLDIAKIAAGRLEVHSEPLVLRPFVLNVASEMESLVSERGLALSIGVAATLPRIRTDQTHLRQILINLIGNAVKYTPSGSINVRASVVGNGTRHGEESGAPAPAAPSPNLDPSRSWLALQVADTGVGIAPADQERIFDEFEQVNAGARTDSARRGTGLGLAISRRLARLIGGDLTVQSEPGHGSTFTVWLPLDVSERKPD